MFAENERVAVCYDGKWTRAVEGFVAGVGPKRSSKGKTPRWIKVRFVPWVNEEAGEVEILCVPEGAGKGKPVSFGGWVKGESEHGVMRMLGCEGDWYGIQKAEVLEKAEYAIKPIGRPVSERDE